MMNDSKILLSVALVFLQLHGSHAMGWGGFGGLGGLGGFGGFGSGSNPPDNTGVTSIGAGGSVGGSGGGSSGGSSQGDGSFHGSSGGFGSADSLGNFDGGSIGSGNFDAGGSDYDSGTTFGFGTGTGGYGSGDVHDYSSAPTLATNWATMVIGGGIAMAMYGDFL